MTTGPKSKSSSPQSSSNVVEGVCVEIAETAVLEVG